MTHEAFRVLLGFNRVFSEEGNFRLLGLGWCWNVELLLSNKHCTYITLFVLLCGCVEEPMKRIRESVEEIYVQKVQVGKNSKNSLNLALRI